MRPETTGPWRRSCQPADAPDPQAGLLREQYASDLRLSSGSVVVSAFVRFHLATHAQTEVQQELWEIEAAETALRERRVSVEHRMDAADGEHTHALRALRIALEGRR